MRTRDILLNPGFIMVALAGLYVFLRVPASRQLGTFVLLSTTAVGAAELVAGIRSLLGAAPREAGVTHLVLGVGFSTLGVSSMLGSIPASIAGSLVVAAGFLYGMRQRVRRT